MNIKRSRVIAASTATLIAAATLAPGVAQAAGQNTLYVDGSSSACTDSGSGTLAAPYCTLQAAADAANPGDVVNLAAGTYAAATITRSGTATSPIRFVAAKGSAQANIYSIVQGLTLNGAAHVEFDGLGLGDTVGTVTVDGGSDVTFAHDVIQGPTATGSTGLHITGGADAVTVIDTRLDSVLIDGGSTGTMLTTNLIGSDYTGPVSIVDAQGTDVTSNQISGCGPLISVTGSSSDTDIENNAVSLDALQPNCPSPAIGYGVLVDSSSAASTASDYNDVHSAGYEWAGKVYGDASSLSAATGQGQHDLNPAQPTAILEGSPTIDSADSAAPGEQSTDYYGKPRVSDPLTADTGAGPYAYYDRGAVEFQDPHTAAAGDTFTASATQAPVGAAISLQAIYGDTWSDAATYEYIVEGPSGSSTVTATGTNTSVSLPTVGTYVISLLVEYAGESSFGYTDKAVVVQAVAAAPLTPAISLSSVSAMEAAASVANTTDAWNVKSVSYDFGDGTAKQTGVGTASVSHTYTQAGTYTVTAKITDAGGNTATATSTFTTTGSDFTAYGPTRILDTRKGVGAAKSKVATGGQVTLKIAGNGSIPTGVTAVALNVTVTDTVGNGFVSVEPDSSNAENSNLNYLAGQTQTNYVIVPVGADGKIDLYVEGSNGGSVDLIADVSGYFTHTAGSGYTAATPARILDTRHGTGAATRKVAPNTGLSVAIVGADSIPSGVTAVAIHITATDATGNGWIAAEADGAGTPTTSILNYLKGQTVSNTVIVPVAADGKIKLYNGGGPGSVDLIGDVTGYFSTTSTEAYIPITPYRAWDSRKNGAPLTANSTYPYELSNFESQPIPAGATLIANLTVTDVTANGFITAYPEGTAQPSVSNLNYLRGQTVAGLSLTATGGGSALMVDVRNQSTGRGDIIFDVFGYFSS